MNRQKLNSGNLMGTYLQATCYPVNSQFLISTLDSVFSQQLWKAVNWKLYNSLFALFIIF